jgi:hypothetical protein
MRTGDFFERSESSVSRPRPSQTRWSYSIANGRGAPGLPVPGGAEKRIRGQSLLFRLRINGDCRISQFRYDGGGMDRGSVMRIYANGQRVAEGRIERQVILVAGLGETFDIGDDTAVPVLDYPDGRSRFNGEINRIEVKPGAMKLSPF